MRRAGGRDRRVKVATGLGTGRGVERVLESFRCLFRRGQRYDLLWNAGIMTFSSSASVQLPNKLVNNTEDLFCDIDITLLPSTSAHLPTHLPYLIGDPFSLG